MGNGKQAGQPLRITVLDGATLNPGDNPWDELDRLGKLTVYDRTPDEEVIARSTGADVLIVNKIRMTGDVLKQLPDLKLIAVTATGYDCVDVAAARQSGVAVCNVPEYGTDSVAQHTFALLLHLCHHIELHDRAVHAGKWRECGDFSFWERPLLALSDKTIGIVGWGRIGQRVGQIAQAFGMAIRAVSRTRRSEPPQGKFQWDDSLETLVAHSDVVSLHCPLTDANRGMINASLLGHFQPHAMLINTSRGALVVEPDLATALHEGQLAAAALDVVSQEPIADDNPLLSAPNCVITPHQAWASLTARKRLMRKAVENIEGFFAGTLVNIVTHLSATSPSGRGRAAGSGEGRGSGE